MSPLMSETLRKSNEERSRAEVETFRREQFGSYFAYLTGRIEPGAKITTWMGDELATITVAGYPWRSNMGDRRQSFRAKAINGATYSGTAFLSSGDYVRMRKVKS